MNKLFVVLALFTSISVANAQFSLPKVKIDGAIGNHFLHSQLTPGYDISNRPFNAFALGFSYMESKKISYRIDLGADLNRTAKNSLFLKNDYYRITFAVGNDLLNYVYRTFKDKEVIRPKYMENLQLYGFVGIGVSSMVNKLKYAKNEPRIDIPYDYMANVTFGLMPTYRFNPLMSVFMKFNVVTHIRQAYNSDMTYYNPNKGFDGAFMNFSVGFSIRPFRDDTYGGSPN